MCLHAKKSEITNEFKYGPVLVGRKWQHGRYNRTFGILRQIRRCSPWNKFRGVNHQNRFFKN